MTHLYIELNTGLTEEVNSSIISKLYELAISGDLDETSDLKGRLHSTVARDTHVSYLTTHYPLLYITADTQYITFTDLEVEKILATKFGDGVGVTNIDMAGVASINSGTGFNGNTDVTLFPELKNFTNLINLNTFSFSRTTNLTTIDLTNIQHIGGEAFISSGITGVIDLPNIVSIGDGMRSSSFSLCTNITEVNIGLNFNNNTLYMGNCFNGCTSLQSVTGLSNITSIPNLMFNECTSLSSVDIDWSKITSIGNRALNKCPIGTGLTLELNLTNQSSHFGEAFGKTEFDKIIVHCSWSGNGDGNHPPFINLPYTTYLDISDCILPTVIGYSLSHLNGDNSLVTIIYPPSVNQIRCGVWGFRAALGTFRYMIILNTTPPDINVDSNNPFSSQFSSNSILHIYVPDSAVSDYLADSKWSQLGGDSGTVTILLRLHGLSELPAGVWTTGLASQYLTPAQLVTT